MVFVIRCITDRIPLPRGNHTSLIGLRQVFRLTDHPTPGAFPGFPSGPCRFRPRSRRRDRVGFAPTSLFRNAKTRSSVTDPGKACQKISPTFQGKALNFPQGTRSRTGVPPFPADIHAGYDAPRLSRAAKPFIPEWFQEGMDKHPLAIPSRSTRGLVDTCTAYPPPFPLKER